MHVADAHSFLNQHDKWRPRIASRSLYLEIIAPCSAATPPAKSDAQKRALEIEIVVSTPHYYLSLSTYSFIALHSDNKLSNAS